VGATPVDRGKPGSTLQLVCDGSGLPLTAANVNDSSTFEAVLDDVPAVGAPAGRRRTRPGTVHADKGYDRAATGPG
jgi:Transposase DDE domain